VNYNVFDILKKYAYYNVFYNEYESMEQLWYVHAVLCLTDGH